MEGVWWSIDRQSIWIVEGGQKKEQIDEQTAIEMAQRLGVTFPEEFQQEEQTLKTEE